MKVDFWIIGLLDFRNLPCRGSVLPFTLYVSRFTVPVSLLHLSNTRSLHYSNFRRAQRI